MRSPAEHDSDPVPATTAGTGSRHAQRVPVLLGAGLLLVMLVRAVLLQPYAVTTDSMAPTLSTGDRVLVTKVGAAQVGDVVVADVTRAWPGPDRATHTDDGLIGGVLSSAAGVLGIDLGERSVLGRVVATGGDEVVVADGVVSVEGREVASVGDGAPALRLTVPAGRLFLLSDNGQQASDSRTWAAANTSSDSRAGDGTVPVDAVIGTVSTRIWPVTRIGALPTPSTTP